MENKQIAKQFIDNLFVNDDLAYEVLAEEDIVGKDNLRNFLANGGPDKIISQKINNLIGEGDVVIGDGTMVTERHGKTETSHFADVYTIKDGKIKDVNSYMVSDKSNKNQE